MIARETDINAYFLIFRLGKFGDYSEKNSSKFPGKYVFPAQLISGKIFEKTVLAKINPDTF